MMYKHILNIVLILSISYGSSWVWLNSEKSIDPLVISSNIQETQLSFEFTGYYSNEVITSNGVEHIIDLEGGSSILESGAPDLDKYTSSIIIPDEGITSIEVISSSYHDFYNIDLGKATSHGMEITEGLAYKKYEKGLIAYNRTKFKYIIKFKDGKKVEIGPLEGVFIKG